MKYRNHNENIDCFTCRGVRNLVVIHHIDELDVICELGLIATAVDIKQKLEVQHEH